MLSENCYIYISNQNNFEIQKITVSGIDKKGLLGTSFSMTDGFYQTTFYEKQLFFVNGNLSKP